MEHYNTGQTGQGGLTGEGYGTEYGPEKIIVLAYTGHTEGLKKGEEMRESRWREQGERETKKRKESFPLSLLPYCSW